MNRKKGNGIWKKCIVMAMTFAMLLSLCGCIRYRLQSSVHEDGSVDITLLYAVMDTSSFDEEGGTGTESLLTDAAKQTLEENGWTCEEYTGEPGDTMDYVGYRISKSGIAFEDLQAELTSEEVGIAGFSCSKDGDVYIMKWDVSTEQSDASTEGIDNNLLEEYGGYMELSVELPNGALYENATSKDGFVYTWKIMTMTEAIHIEYTLDGTVPAGYETQPTTETTTAETTDETKTDPAVESETDPTTEATTEPTTEVTTEPTTEETTEAAIEETTEETKKTKATDDDDEDDEEEEPSEKSKKNKKDKKTKDEEKTFPIWALVTIVGGVIVVTAAVVTVVVVKRKNTES